MLHKDTGNGETQVSVIQEKTGHRESGKCWDFL